MPDDAVLTRRYGADPRGRRIDPRATFRRSLRAGGGAIDLALRAPKLRHPPVVAICDISGSMSEYTRVFLHFLHALTEKRRRVHTLLFGTRLTSVTRALTAKDIDEALAKCSSGVQDWSRGHTDRSVAPRLQPRLVAARAWPGRHRAAFHRWSRTRR